MNIVYMMLFRNVLFVQQGRAEAYGSLQELLSLGVDPTRLVGIEKEGQDMYSVCSDGVNEDTDITEGMNMQIGVMSTCVLVSISLCLKYKTSQAKYTVNQISSCENILVLNFRINIFLWIKPSSMKIEYTIYPQQSLASISTCLHF